MGCELPEHVRQYYLDVMEITCWQEQVGFSPTETSMPSAEVIITQPINVEKIALQESVLKDEPINRSEIPNKKADISWQSLEQSISQCEICTELCKSRTQTIFGSGNRQAKIMLVTEAPNVEEDQRGEPFVGQVGNLLNAMLKAIGLERQDVFITHCIKCLTPEARHPKPQEVLNCSDYLRQQVALIKPQAILAVGGVAAHSLLNTDVAVGKLRGETYDYNGTPVIVTYHPSYLLHKPREKRQSWQDILRLQALM